MKKIFLLFALIAVTSACYAQGTFSNTGSGLNDLGKYMDEADSLGNEEAYTGEEEKNESAFDKKDPLRDLTMESSDSSIQFENFPGKNKLTAHVTNADGELLIEKTVSEMKKEVDVHKLPKELFFVTVTYRSHRKAFTLDRAADAGNDPKKSESKKQTD